MSLPSIRRLARLHGVLPEYVDGFRRVRSPTDEALLSVLGELGAEVDGAGDVPAAIRSARQNRWQRLTEPVVVCWEHCTPALPLRLTPAEARTGVEITLRSEEGQVSEWSVRADALLPRRRVVVEGCSYATFRVPLPESLPRGYHRLFVRAAQRTAEALVISAPRRAADLQRTWGAFIPLYALHSRRSPAAGTFTELGELIEWVQDLGGGLVSTLPLLATFLDTPFAPSPYTPVSRCFWNEFYLDLRQVPEWRSEFGGIGCDTGDRFVDYRGLMRAKRSALERSAASLAGPRYESLVAHLGANPELRAYASFRAGTERGHASEAPFDVAEPGCLYHGYVQWLAEGQMAALAESASRRGPGLSLDLPLGVHRLGFDSYRHAPIFARNMTGGAPPDRFFSKGQDWGFAPLDPNRARARGHGYFIACLRHHMRHAGVLRIDHVMGLHRMYWIPRGFDGDQGVYVRYPADELYAIVCLESRRHGTAIVGEDLGTVPAAVRRRMAGHGLRRTYVAQFEFREDLSEPATDPPKGSVATVNTHDTAMFAAFWTGVDIEDQCRLGLLDSEHAARAHERRRNLRNALLAQLVATGALDQKDATPDAVLRACLAELSASDAECVIVTLEDLWGEASPQNTPGTDTERPNWTRRSALSLDRVCLDPGVREVARQMSRGRGIRGSGCECKS